MAYLRIFTLNLLCPHSIPCFYSIPPCLHSTASIPLCPHSIPLSCSIPLCPHSIPLSCSIPQGVRCQAIGQNKIPDCPSVFHGSPPPGRRPFPSQGQDGGDSPSDSYDSSLPPSSYHVSAYCTPDNSTHTTFNLRSYHCPKTVSPATVYVMVGNCIGDILRSQAVG